MACFTCKFWDREKTFTKNGHIRKGFVAPCQFPVLIPTNAPAAMQMVNMNWDDGTGCQTWEIFPGTIEFHAWAE